MDKDDDFNLPLFGRFQGKRGIAYVRRQDIKKGKEDIAKVKVYVPASAGSGNDRKILGEPWLSEIPSACTQTFLYAAFNEPCEAVSFISYYKTKFFRALVSSLKITQECPKRMYRFVPLLPLHEKALTDKELYEMFGLTDSEINFIEANVTPWL